MSANLGLPSELYYKFAGIVRIEGNNITQALIKHMRYYVREEEEKGE